MYQNKWRWKRLFLPHVRDQTHIQFFPSHTKPTHILNKIPQTTRIWCHFQNKLYKTTSRILSDLTIPGEHHTTRKQDQNRKRIKKTFLHHTFENSFLITFSSPFSLPWPQRHHIIDRVLRHHLIVNIFWRNKICRNPFLSTLFYFFPTSSLKLSQKIFNETRHIWL